ncbi:hypothetical protein XELAEV_18004031mg [Xenopus laevis]|uniref:Uncharacterized protein n=1 Tax=Xenopus laevis TaxID=8355 RepID=A0A974GZZ5_XENLA|nr:hypothetical protein XELAEV_18004031mg [Xenopus laevis]
MAAADLRADLSCSICLSIYTDPVSLPCAHNFCQVCIGTTWDTQEGSGAYSCPECRAEYQERPALYRNRTLGNIAERFRPTETECFVHNALLTHYCYEHHVCICVSCALAREHRGHRVELLSEASERTIERLRREATDLLLDINTAANNVSVSGDRKSASYSHTELHYPQTPERFQGPQVLCTRSFSSGRHYWEVEVSKTGDWRVGVTYPSIERGGDQSCIGYNNKSWCLCRWSINNSYIMTHDSNNTKLPHILSCGRIRISLDYEAGRLSFHELSEPIRHLHTFTATFTEPLYIGCGVGGDGTWVRIIS